MTVYVLAKRFFLESLCPSVFRTKEEAQAEMERCIKECSADWIDTGDIDEDMVEDSMEIDDDYAWIEDRRGDRFEMDIFEVEF